MPGIEDHSGEVQATLAREMGLSSGRVAATLRLLADGNTVPFIARYRKEATGGLDEVQIRAIQQRHEALVDLERRRQTVLQSIEGQGRLTEALRDRILACGTRAALEDLYLPYRPRRRTRASVARERGLEPLAMRILSQDLRGDPGQEARSFVDAAREVPDAEAALAGARDIVAEEVSIRADVRAVVREETRSRGILCSAAIPSKTREPTRYDSLQDARQPLSRVASHRYLAMRRGEREGVLRVRIEVDEAWLLQRILGIVGAVLQSPWHGDLVAAVEDGFRRLLVPSIENEVHREVTEWAEREAVEVFAANLRELLLAPPLGARPVIGVDPGLRTGCKVAAVDGTGRLLGHGVIFPHTGGEDRARADFLAMVRRHRPAAVAVGNGTAGRETEAFLREVLETGEIRDVPVVTVSEAGASVYSASDLAREEFPDLDLTVRGAIHIARRLQDPLAELVKVDPRALGVGQYQHDVDEGLLKRRLDEVVESCVNRVGVDVNTASASLLSYVSGIGPALARSIVEVRQRQGPFRNRRQLAEVPRLGPRAFEQAAGFLRVRGGDHPLDATAVHPERYPLVERMARDLGLPLAALPGNAGAVDRIDPGRYVGPEVGEPTLRDILEELKRPGRDPRETFEPLRFREDVRRLEDLVPGMVLEGVVTNVTAFGAFVDVGVHQDGLVHVSELADRFVRDPAEVVRVGQRVQVRVIAVDVPRRRVSLSRKGLVGT
ncbi:MAG TPA: Tex family protein [Myxococcota bacterium]|nr:Tex family protein [Myxococcota bacterium]HQK52521.1 Tex family protein [Myxococcota bacterium]